ncbi:hypothetical protein EIP91_005462 [Steccherinum ochraceum]|uniref:Uncharacterized protein n=1 Tax=Steccherinum ochraceum TaxID=92696 RepID=A0A4R0RUH6_9APHY|nr:hypothetical protein EIP91_005462 [Steccherinum ochraceum]
MGKAIPAFLMSSDTELSRVDGFAEAVPTSLGRLRITYEVQVYQIFLDQVTLLVQGHDERRAVTTHNNIHHANSYCLFAPLPIFIVNFTGRIFIVASFRVVALFVIPTFLLAVWVIAALLTASFCVHGHPPKNIRPGYFALAYTMPYDLHFHRPQPHTIPKYDSLLLTLLDDDVNL